MKSLWTFRIKIGIGFTLSCLVVALVGIVGYRSIEQLVLASQRVTNTNEVLQDLSELLSALKDTETGERGYIITGSEVYLEPYRPAEAAALEALRRLRELAVDSPEQRQMVEVAAGLVQSKLALAKRIVEVRRSQGFDAAAKLVETDEDKSMMDKLRAVVAEMKAGDQRLLSGQMALAAAGALNSQRIIFASSLCSFILVGVMGWFITSSLSRQIGSAADHLQSSSAQLQTVANQQLIGSTEQAAAINEVATTIVELLSTSRQISESSQRVAESARETSAAAVKGGDTVQRSTQSIAGIKTLVDIVVSHVLELGKKSQQIEGITEIINELAEQTNILAINATIEAAGAGEWGKRFAVVADEIRKLADRVAGSAAEIRQLLDNIQVSANSTAVATEDSSKAVETGVREFGEVAVLFKQIALLVSTASEAAREIELSTRQQTSAVDQVRSGASDLVQAAHENETGSKQMLQTSSELAALSRELVQMIQARGYQHENGTAAAA